MRRVMIGTPALTGELDVLYVDSLINSIRECANQNIILYPVFIANESMLPVARNDLMHYAYEADMDDLVFIDADQQWTPQQLLRLLLHDVDLVGGTCRKKILEKEIYVAKIFNNENPLYVNDNGLAKVQGVGAGFLRLTKTCIKKLYESSELYDNSRRFVFEYKIIDGNFIGEDLSMCYKWQELGGDVYLDTEITVNHIGKINFVGNFKEWAIKNKILHSEN